MSEEQLQQIVQGVAQAIQQGAKPEEILQQLVQQGMPQDVAQQVIQAAMQGGEGMASTGGIYTQREAQQLIETALGELGPEVLMALLMAYDHLEQANKQALMQQLGQMVQQGKGAANAQTAPAGEGMQASAVQENLFGRQ